MPFSRAVGLSLGAAIFICSSTLNLASAKPFMIVGNDEKVWWDDDGKTILSAPGKDTVLIVDLANPESPKIVATLPLKNSIVGPPVNVDIDPSGSVALVADSVDVTKDGDALKQVPDNKVYVINLKASPPKLASTVTVGKQPSGLSISPSGKMALSNDNGGAGSSDGSVDTVSVIDLEANPPRVIDKVVVGDGPEGMAMSPKGDLAVSAILSGSNNKKAFFYKKNGSLSILKIDGKKVTKTQDMEVGGLPEAVLFTPDGKYILAGNYMTQDFSILKVNGTKVTDTGKRFKVPGHPASARMGH